MKKLLLIVMILTLTGCTANYKITIDDKKISEEVKILEYNLKITDKDLNKELDQIIVSNADESAETGFYLFKKIIGESISGIMMSTTYDKAVDYDNYSVFLSRCYDDITVDYDNDYINIITSSKFKCFSYFKNLDMVKLEVSTKYKVVDSNYDYKEGTSYYWDILKDDNRPIEIKIKKVLANPTIFEIINESVELQMAILFVGFLFIPGVLVTIGYLKYKKQSQL